MASTSQIAVWVGNVPHALSKKTLVEVLARLAGGDFVEPTKVIMTHRGAVQDNLDSWAKLHFAIRSAAEQAAFLLNGYYSQQLGKRLVARVANSMTTSRNRDSKSRRCERSSSRNGCSRHGLRASSQARGGCIKGELANDVAAASPASWVARRSRLRLGRTAP